MIDPQLARALADVEFLERVGRRELWPERTMSNLALFRVYMPRYSDDALSHYANFVGHQANVVRAILSNFAAQDNKN